MACFSKMAGKLNFPTARADAKPLLFIVHRKGISLSQCMMLLVIFDYCQIAVLWYHSTEVMDLPFYRVGCI
uniref:Uncharacterized protein MANES_12G029600 n=1 Tax=Rhizophora mucronata TaxID=61149 RepID=A0A2P2IV20_RHIMU